MTELTLIRHAESIWHAEDRYCGSSDVELTAAGHRQAELLAQWAESADLSAIWTSPLQRCQLTAVPCAIATGLKPVVDTRLRELDFGSLEGKTKSEARAIFPDAFEAFLRNPAVNHFSDGESPRAAAMRAVACMSTIATNYPDQHVMIVAHSTLIRLALCSLLEVDLADYRTRFPTILNCSITRIRFDINRTGILSFNIPVETILSGKAHLL